MKIAVCVKQVPEARRPAADRPADEAARPLRRSGAQRVRRERGRGGAAHQGGGGDGEVVLVSLGPERAADSLRKALAMGADRAVLVADEARGRLRPRRHQPRAREGARARGRRPRPLRPAGERLRRRRALGRRRRAAAPAARLAGRRAHGRRRHGEGEAPDRVRLRPDRGAAPRRDRRLGRDQRAALPVAQGDHGREVEAAGDRSRSPTSASTRPTPARAGANTEVLALAPPPAARRHAARSRTTARAPQKIVEFLAEKKLL